VELTVLGTSAAYPAPGGAASGYLVRHDGFNLVLDFGTGALANLQEHVGITEIGAMVISHEHPDHCLDLYPLWLALFFHPDRVPAIPLAAPVGVFDRVARLHRGEDEVRDMRQRFDVREVEPGDAVELGPFSIRTRPMRHLVTTIGVRVEADGTSLAYTGDTGPTEEVEELGREADVLIAENSWLDGQGTGPFHLTAREAGQHADRAGARRLVLSHFWPTNPREPSRQQAADAFDGEVVLAEEGMNLEVGG
jgi:ribonuclease BN (tRNA processing enzyme)